MLPVNVCIGQVRGIGLGCADEPEQLKIKLPFGIHCGHQRDVFRLGDGAFILLRHLRPKLAWQNRRRNPAHADGVIVHCLQESYRLFSAHFQRGQ